MVGMYWWHLDRLSLIFRHPCNADATALLAWVKSGVLGESLCRMP